MFEMGAKMLDYLGLCSIVKTSAVVVVSPIRGNTVCTQYACASALRSVIASVTNTI